MSPPSLFATILRRVGHGYSEGTAAGSLIVPNWRLKTRQSVAPEPEWALLEPFRVEGSAYWLGLLDAMTVTGVSR